MSKYIYIIIYLNFLLIGASFGREIITNSKGPYDYQTANWRAGNYIQSLFYDYSSVPALSENFIGKDVVPVNRLPDLYYFGNAGIDILDFSEEAEFTPLVRLDLIKRLYKGLAASAYPSADNLWVTYSGTKRQTSVVRPSSAVTPQYPGSRLLTRNLPDTVKENLAMVYPRCKVSDVWYDDSSYSFTDLSDNVYQPADGSYLTKRIFSSASLPEIEMRGFGWDGDRDKMVALELISAADASRESIQLAITSFVDPGMAFTAPYPTEIPETIQLPNEAEVTGVDWSISSPSYQHLIIYTKDADKSGNAYQNALLVIWEGTPSKVTVDWESGAYRSVYIEYSGSGDIDERIWLERFQGVDPSASLGHIHNIGNNMVNQGTVGMPGFMAAESGWMEEIVSGLAAGAYILCEYDSAEDQFGGDDYAVTAQQFSTQMLDDRISMWGGRGREPSDYHEFVTAAYYLAKLYDLPGRFYNTTRRDYYKNWMKIWADRLVNDNRRGARVMMSLWRAYELTGDITYSDRYNSLRSDYEVSEETGLKRYGIWKTPRDFYGYGDFLGAIGRRGNAQDVEDIQKLINYLANQKRWTDNGYMGVWWEVTVENHNYFGRWCKGLGMESFPKTIVSISEFPRYYKDGENIVIDLNGKPAIYNPSYWDQDVMSDYERYVPGRLAESILFRIDNILLKNDYHNNWWTGSSNTSVIADLNAIRAKTASVLAYVNGGAGDYSSSMQLLNECGTLYGSVINLIESDLTTEAIVTRMNNDHLKAVLPGFATVVLGDLLQTWDGSAKNVSIATDPAGLTVDLTYNGLTNAPVGPESYTVIGVVNDPIYEGSATNTLVIQMPAAYDAWRAVWFMEEQQTNNAVSGPEVYFDGDQYSNWEEYIAGTNPTDGTAVPSFQMQPEAAVPDGYDYILDWNSVSGRVYSVNWSPDLLQPFTLLKTNIQWPQSSYTDQTHQVETKGFYRMNVFLPTATTNAAITLGSIAEGVAGDLFQGAAVTTNSVLIPSTVATDLFSKGSPVVAENVIFADNTGDTLSFVEFNIPRAVSLGNITIGLIADPDGIRALSHIKVYAAPSAGIVLDTLVADIAVDPDYATAYGSRLISVSIDLAVNARFFRVEFTDADDVRAPRVMEIDGFAQ